MHAITSPVGFPAFKRRFPPQHDWVFTQILAKLTQRPLSMKINSILVANRGEIAARVIRTIRDLGLRSVAVYSPSDAQTPAVELADDAYVLEGSTPQETYLNTDKIIDIAKRSGAEAVHPGYGFLSESPSAARSITEANLVWLGPSAETIERLGNKLNARRLAQRAEVRTIPGSMQPICDMNEVDGFVDTHGFPVILKRFDGGGGRSIETLHSKEDIEDFGKRHAVTGGDIDRFFIEKLINSGRHVETQCMRDTRGNFSLVTTRDCSVQRRHQKIIEEAPAPFITEPTLATLRNWSRKLFEHSNYVGIGTCEFLLTKGGEVFFLEVNPRIQVEHTVSEEITGIDLVEAQIILATGGTLPDVPEPRGHSIELRITSEDPSNNLTPASGSIHELAWPIGHGVRIESGISLGGEVNPEFDSTVAKLVVTGPNRARSIARAHRALAELKIKGVTTCAPLLHVVLEHPDFNASNRSGMKIHTRWMEEELLESLTEKELESLGRVTPEGDQNMMLSDWTAHSIVDPTQTFRAQIDDRLHRVSFPDGIPIPKTTTSSLNPANLSCIDCSTATGEKKRQRVQPLRNSGQVRRRQASLSEVGQNELTNKGEVFAPKQGIVVRVCVEHGQQIRKGDIAIVLEAMKMETYVHAPVSGTLTSIDVQIGQKVSAGTPLMCIKTSE